MWRLAQRPLPHHRSRSVVCSNDGGALQLYESVGIPEPGHTYSRHRWVVPAAEPLPYLPDLSSVRPVSLEVHGVDREGDKITGFAAGCAEGCEQVAKGSLKLRDDPAGHDLAVRGVTCLPGQENQPPAGGGHCVGETRRPAQFTGVDPLDAHGPVIPHRPSGAGDLVRLVSLVPGNPGRRRRSRVRS